MRVWSDGKVHLPKFPEMPPVIKCDGCERCYFLDAAEVVGEFSPGTLEDVPVEWHEAPPAEEPSEADYYDAIRSGLARDHPQERLLRIRAWWRSNDPHREPDEDADLVRRLIKEREEHDELMLSALSVMDEQSREEQLRRYPHLRRLLARKRRTAPRRPARIPTQAERDDNLRALVSLLNRADDNDLVMKGEVLRELGWCYEARKVLDQVSSHSYAQIVEQIRSFCVSGDRTVRELRYDVGPGFGSPYTQ